MLVVAVLFGGVVAGSEGLASGGEVERDFPLAVEAFRLCSGGRGLDAVAVDVVLGDDAELCSVWRVGLEFWTEAGFSFHELMFALAGAAGVFGFWMGAEVTVG